MQSLPQTSVADQVRQLQLQLRGSLSPHDAQKPNAANPLQRATMPLKKLGSFSTEKKISGRAMTPTTSRLGTRWWLSPFRGLYGTKCLELWKQSIKTGQSSARLMRDVEPATKAKFESTGASRTRPRKNFAILESTLTSAHCLTYVLRSAASRKKRKDSTRED